MKMVEVGDYTFKFLMYSEVNQYLCSALQIINYNVEVLKNNVLINSDKTNLYEDLGITKEEFLDLIVEETKELIAKKLQRIFNEDGPATPIRSFIFFAINDRTSLVASFYGFTEHDIFKRISDSYPLLHHQVWDNGEIYVHTRELFLKYAPKYVPEHADGFAKDVVGFDFHANTSLIKTIYNKIKANQGINGKSIVEKVFEELL